MEFGFNCRCLFVCLSVSLRINFRTDLHEIFMEVGNGPMNKCLNFGGDPDHRVDTGVVFRIRHYCEIRKVVNGHIFVLIRQMTALGKRALADVCTVPVLLHCVSKKFPPFNCL